VEGDFPQGVRRRKEDSSDGRRLAIDLNLGDALKKFDEIAAPI